MGLASTSTFGNSAKLILEYLTHTQQKCQGLKTFHQLKQEVCGKSANQCLQMVLSQAKTSKATISLL